MKNIFQAKSGQPGKITLPGISACVFFGCFLIGVFAANLCLSDEALWIGFVNENNLLQFTRGQQEVSAFFAFALRYRLIPWILLMVLGYFSWGGAVCTAWIGWIGVSGGFLFASMIQRHGAKGILLMGGMGLPQYVLYAAAYIIFIHLVWAFHREKKMRRAELLLSGNKKKYVWIYFLFVILVSGVFILGIMTEYYVNPIILEKLR